MKRIFIGFLALLFPWLLFLVQGQFMNALVALALQASVIGWLFATPWVWRESAALYTKPPVPPAETDDRANTDLKS